jgi:dTDP-4-dehydrorhamnose 3,5-epimerase-like enzyme
LDNIDLYGIKRIYCVENFSKGQVRSWHGHVGGATYLYCIGGSLKCAAMSLDNYDDLVEGVLTARTPRLFYIGPGYANGTMALTDNTKLIVMSTLSFVEVKKDDARLRWDIHNTGEKVWNVRNR